jgi:acyl-CoA thioesterase FadM
LDSLGHVNNAVYLNWLEHARWRLITDTPPPEHRTSVKAALDFWFGPGMVPVLRQCELEFLESVHLGDALEIVLFPRSVSKTTFVLGSTMRL